MPKTQDDTHAGKLFGTQLEKPDEKILKRLNHMLSEMFIDTMSQRRNIIRYREQYQGIDNEFYRIFGLDPNTDAHLTLPGLTSMMIYNFTQIVTSRFYTSFVNDYGEYVRVLPCKLKSIPSADALTHLINHYFRQNNYMRQTMYEIFRGAVRDGVAISQQYWKYKQTTEKISRQPRLKYNPKIQQYEAANDLTIKRTIPLIDRPEIDYVDPLMFGMQPGVKYLNRDAQICVHKDIFYRYELEGMVKRGFINKSFNELKDTQVGGKHTNEYEAPEMREYYQDIFDENLNRGLEWEDPFHRFIVDKVWEGSTEDDDVTNYWLINGNVVRVAKWEGGHEIPYSIHQFTPTDTSWMGMGIPEIIQDYYREDNLMTRQLLAVTRKAGKWTLLIPKSAQLNQEQTSKMVEEGGVIQYDESILQTGQSLQNLIQQFKLGEPSDALSRQRDDTRKQAEINAGISLPEIAGADLPSALRSGKLLSGLGSQSSRPAQMHISLMGESMSRAYEQIKTLIYRLQDEEVQVILDETTAAITTVSVEQLDAFPDTYVRPNTETSQLSDAQAQLAIQMLPFLQQVSVPPQTPQEMLNFRSVIETVADSVLGPEVGKRFVAKMGSGLGPAPQTLAGQQLLQLQQAQAAQGGQGFSPLPANNQVLPTQPDPSRQTQ